VKVPANLLMRTNGAGVLWLAQLFQAKKIAEIGIYRAHSIITVFKRYKQWTEGIEEYWAIDPYTTDSFRKGCLRGGVLPKRIAEAQPYRVYQQIKTMIEEYPELYSKVHLIKEYAHNVVGEFPDGYFDLVYIDGDHSYEGMMRDLPMWEPKTRILGGHDYSITNDGVIKAVMERYGEDGHIVLPPCHWVKKWE